MTQQQLKNLIDGKLMISDIIEIDDPDEFERRLFVLSIAEDGNVFVYDEENDDIVSLDVILNEEFPYMDADVFQIYRLENYDSDLPNAIKNYKHFTENNYIQYYYRVLIEKGGSLDLSEHKISIEIKFS